MLARDPATGAVGCGGSSFNLRTARMKRLQDKELDGPVRVDSIGNDVWPFYRPPRAGGARSFDPQLFFGFEELDLGLDSKVPDTTSTATGRSGSNRAGGWVALTCSFDRGCAGVAQRGAATIPSGT